MKSLDNFIMEAAARRKASEEDIEQINKRKAAEAEKKEGKSAEENGTHGLWAIDEPYDDGAVEPLQKDQLNKNMKRLLMKFKSKEPFFIIGEAGWGKTSIIKDLARRHKRAVVTVYLDKAVASDLGGVPVPVKGKKGNAQLEQAMPQWASYMLEHADQQFLLFFDEMNQAAPDVMNALMPIVLENEICGIRFKNFMVGAAGNFEHENGAVSELSGPLKSRFKPIIIWETGGEGEWKQAFSYMHKKWDDKLSKSLINKFEENAALFENPREVEHKILKFAYELKQDEDFDMFDAEDYLDRLEGLVKDDLTRSQKDDLVKLAEAIDNYLHGREEEGNGRKRRGGTAPIDETTKKMITKAIKNGYVAFDLGNKRVKCGVSEDNVYDMFCDPEIFEPEQWGEIHKESLEMLIDKLKEDGVDFKYKTKDEWKNKGYLDAIEDSEDDI